MHSRSLSEWIIFSYVFEIVRGSYKLDNITGWLSTSFTRKYLQEIQIVTKNILDFIDRVAFFFSSTIGRGEKNGGVDVRKCLRRETCFSDTESYCFIAQLGDERIFIAKVVSYFTDDGKRKLIGSEKIHLSCRQYALVYEIAPGRY